MKNNTWTVALFSLDSHPVYVLKHKTNISDMVMYQNIPLYAQDESTICAETAITHSTTINQKACEGAQIIKENKLEKQIEILQNQQLWYLKLSQQNIH